MDKKQYGNVTRIYTKLKNLLADYDNFLDSPDVYDIIEDMGLHYESNKIYSDLNFMTDTFLKMLQEIERDLVYDKTSSNF